MSDIKLPEKFRIPADRIPKAWSQGPYDCCVMASFVKVLEIINYVKTGEYTMLSKGYAYGRHSHPNFKSFKVGGGGDYDYAVNSLLTRGSVPEEMYPHMNEIPNIMHDVENASNLAELDKEAEKTKIKSFVKIPGNAYVKETIKKYLYEKQMPLVGNMTGKHHCTVIVGWDEDGFEFCDHDGRTDEKTGRSWVYGGGRFNEAYYLEGYVENNIAPSEKPEKEEEKVPYKLIDISEFKNYLDSLKITRKITVVQLHHTYSPSYKQFTGDNHASLQNGMRNYHISEMECVDIAQHFTIFPDGKICAGRDINTSPAGIKGANTGAICIECLGNFDIGGDVMTNAQRNSIIGTVKTLLDKFGLNAEKDVTYHAWWTSEGKSLGTYIKGKSAKTCPGTNFFGGNIREMYEKNLMPLIENAIIVDGEVLTNKGRKEENDMELKPVTEINDIVWELANAGVITDSKLWMKKCEEDINVYWLCRKMANKLRGTL